MYMALSTCSSGNHFFLQKNDMVPRNPLQLALETRLIITLPTRFGRGCRISLSNKPRHGICSCWTAGSQLATTAFTVGTVTVLPLYTLMVVSPKSEFTKKAMDSSIPYVVLGVLYAYLLHLSWTPDTIRLMFASKYWLPELPGIMKMFSGEMTLASAWIHLLLVDLFAARCIYKDGLENEIETRHSVSLCLLVCPIGILAHTVTKALSRTRLGIRKRNT